MKEKTRKVLEYADQGLTVPQISKLTGVKKKSIYKYLYKYRGCISAKVNEQISDKDAVLIDLRNKGLTYTEIERITGRNRSDIGKRCKQLGIAYDPSEDHSGRKQEEQFAEELKSKDIGIVYVSGYINNKSNVIVHRTACGHEFEWNASNLRKHDYINGVKCPVCYEKIKEDKRRKKSEEKKNKEIKKIADLSKKRIDRYLTKRFGNEFRTCEECGNIFIAARNNTKKRFCSEICGNRHSDRIKRQRRNERIKNRDHYEVIELRKIYSKYDGICALCGKKTDFDDYEIKVGSDGRETFIAGNNYPSLDHIIPLSKGGENVWTNAQLAHRLCNSIKGSA